MRRNFSNEQKNKIWKAENGAKTTGIDPFGRVVNKKTAHVDHIIPYSKGGKTTLKNGQILSPKSNIEKSDKLSGSINNRSFVVNKKTNNMIVKNKK